MRQWVLKITDYADRMLADLDKLPKWPDGVKEAQRHWIGKSEGSEIDFAIKGTDEKITVFTTRADTLFGVTYVVFAPEHPLITSLKSQISNVSEVEKYIEEAKNKDDITRTAVGKEKTGVKLEGIFAINPANGEEASVWVADYVLPNYGTGAVMAVPAHDERDFQFAQKYNLSVDRAVITVSGNVNPELRASTSDDSVFSKKHIEKHGAFTEDGYLINSLGFNGLQGDEARQKITEAVGGKIVTKYRIKDWVFSRQRYWGEPIPIIHCSKCGVVPVPEKDLPVTLPNVENYAPTGTGESPLADIVDWINVSCPTCGESAKRETNTMPQWAGSSWYYLRFIDPKNTNALIDTGLEKKWTPVDVYVGGDHATRHLIYARFWHKFLFDIGVVTTEEPFPRLEFLGFILAHDGRKMSKRWGNIVNPDEMVERFGADSFRLYEMFIGPFEYTALWNTNGLVGTSRFLERVWRLKDRLQEGNSTDDATLHKTIKKIGEDIEGFKFNTAVSAMMICINEMEKMETVSVGDYKRFLQILAPFAPHMTEELWHELGESNSIHHSTWPTFDVTKLESDTTTITLSINGKARDQIVVAKDMSQADVEALAKASEKIQAHLNGVEPKRVIYVQGKLVNFVI
jgi:leucyl-tRNA synthetase